MQGILVGPTCIGSWDWDSLTLTVSCLPSPSCPPSLSRLPCRTFSLIPWRRNEDASAWMKEVRSLHPSVPSAAATAATKAATMTLQRNDMSNSFAIELAVARRSACPRGPEKKRPQTKMSLKDMLPEKYNHFRKCSQMRSSKCTFHISRRQKTTECQCVLVTSVPSFAFLYISRQDLFVQLESFPSAGLRKDVGSCQHPCAFQTQVGKNLTPRLRYKQLSC